MTHTTIPVDVDEEYHDWVSKNIQEYIASRRTPYNIVFAFGNDKQVHVTAYNCQYYYNNHIRIVCGTRLMMLLLLP